jgi:hypothetical protein
MIEELSSIVIGNAALRLSCVSASSSTRNHQRSKIIRAVVNNAVAIITTTFVVPEAAKTDVGQVI